MNCLNALYASGFVVYRIRSSIKGVYKYVNISWYCDSVSNVCTFSVVGGYVPARASPFAPRNHWTVGFRGRSRGDFNTSRDSEDIVVVLGACVTPPTEITSTTGIRHETAVKPVRFAKICILGDKTGVWS
jgi:hypothetical protein